MQPGESIGLLRDCEVVLIPSGEPLRLAAGTPVTLSQSLGGNHTLEVQGRLARLDGRDADALGLPAEPSRFAGDTVHEPIPHPDPLPSDGRGQAQGTSGNIPSQLRQDTSDDSPSPIGWERAGVGVPSPEPRSSGREEAHSLSEAGSQSLLTSAATVHDPNAPPKSEAGVTPVDEALIWKQLRRCYDPEIPVDIVELGLIYGLQVAPHPEGGSQVEVKMTLTAPGCGMGATIAQDVQNKVLGVPGVTEVRVDLVFDPPWSQEMMSEAAKLQLGLM